MRSTIARRRNQPSVPTRSAPWKILFAAIAVVGIVWTTWHFRDSLEPPLANPSGVLRAANGEAIRLLRKMQLAYGRLTSYADRTQMVLRMRRNGEWLTDHAVVEIRWQTSDQIALRVAHGLRQFHVAAYDGTIQARIEDPEFEEFGNQTVLQNRTGKLSLTAIHECLDIVNPQEPTVRYSALATLPAPLTLTPLSLLLDSQAVEAMIRDATQLALLPTASLRGQPAQRVQVANEDGTFVLWIDQETELLRRIELPLPKGDPAVQQFSLAVDFLEIETNQRWEPSDFRFSGPPGTQFVHHFVLPPSQYVPDALGAVVEGLDFIDLAGNRVTDALWNDRIAVLVWFSRHPSSQAILTELEKLATDPTAAEGCFFLAVCTEPTTSMSHRDIADLMRQWSVSIETVRDLNAVGRDVLRIERAPTLIILDRHRRLQRRQEGGDLSLHTELAQFLDGLRHQGDQVDRSRQALDQQWHEYRRILAEATVPASPN